MKACKLFLLILMVILPSISFASNQIRKEEMIELTASIMLIKVTDETGAMCYVIARDSTFTRPGPVSISCIK